MSAHTPNTPRERTGDGRKVDEPVQCRACLQAWPCEHERQAESIRRVRAEVAEREQYEWQEPCTSPLEKAYAHGYETAMRQCADLFRYALDGGQ